MRIERFWRSIWLVQIFVRIGTPITGTAFRGDAFGGARDKGAQVGLPLRTEASIQYVACTADFKIAAVAAGRSVCIFDVVNHARIADLQARRLSSTRFRVSSDGQTPAVSSADEVLVWNLKSGDLRTRACQIANRNLTGQAWQEYVSHVDPMPGNLAFDREPFRPVSNGRNSVCGVQTAQTPLLASIWRPNQMPPSLVFSVRPICK
jgi:hypothetical protein